MKTLILCIAFTVSWSIYSAKEVLKINEARHSDVSSSIMELRQSKPLNIPKKCAPDSDGNLLIFLKKNIEMKNRDHITAKDAYKVICIWRIDKLNADAYPHRKLFYYSFKFKDFLSPSQSMAQFYRDNRGWALASNSYKGKENSFNKSHYMLIMKNVLEKRIFRNNRIAHNKTGGPVYFIKA